MFNNRKEFLDHIRTAPNPKKVREDFLQELQESKEEILDFRQELQKVFQERNPMPPPSESRIDEDQTRQAVSVARHMSKITEQLADIAGGIADMSAKAAKGASVLGRFQ